MNYKLAIVKGQVNYYMLISQIRKKSFPTSVIVPGHRERQRTIQYIHSSAMHNGDSLLFVTQFS